VATRPRWTRARERIRRICTADLDARTLRLEVLEQLRTVLASDAYVWVATDPETEVGASPLAEVPSLAELPATIRLKYLTPVNRWTHLPGRVATLAETTGGDLAKSLFWRRMLSRYGVEDVLSSVQRDRYGCWGFLDLWRIGGRFDRAETDFVAEVTPPITKALRRAQAATFVDAGPATADEPVIMLLAADLGVRAQTPATLRLLQLLVPPDGDATPVPAGAYNVGAQLLAVEAGVDPHPPLTRIHLDGGRWVTLRAARLGAEPASGTSEPDARDLAVSIETARPADRAEVFGRAYGLSPRERDLLVALSSGPGTRELAGRLFLAEHTVQDHLRSIFDKTGVRSRSALVGRAFGV
jgi:DNA-binding CsgD family transcriptional regulator